MALVKCDECGHEVSTRAAACPACGAPVVLPRTAQPQAAESLEPEISVVLRNTLSRISPRVAIPVTLVLIVVSGWFFLRYDTLSPCRALKEEHHRGMERLAEKFGRDSLHEYARELGDRNINSSDFVTCTWHLLRHYAKPKE